MRNDFLTKTKEILAKRVGFLCSNPTCQKLTVGPNMENNKSSNIGIAAHIFAASKGGPRSNKLLSKDEIISIDNGIWLCSNCATLIDRNENKYNVELLKTWRKKAEDFAETLLESNRIIQRHKLKYDGYQFDNALEATWAVFFKQLTWAYVYKPFEFKTWKPKFQILTNSSQENKFLVDIISSSDFNKEFRKQIALETDYAKNILILSEHPFAETEFSKKYPNSIGLTSLAGKIEDEDQEYCCSIVYDFFGEGINIHNLCNLKFELHDMIDREKEFCRDVWKKSKNIINEIITNNNVYN